MSEESTDFEDMSEFSQSSASESRISFFANPNNWPLFYHTARNMKTQQLAGIAERKIRQAVVPRLPIDFDKRYEQQIPENLSPHFGPIRENSKKLRQSLSETEREENRSLAADAADGRFTFLNRPIDFGDEINWNHEKMDEYPLLWRLKLQSLEHLEWLFLGYDDPEDARSLNHSFERWFLSWSKENPIGEEKYLRRSWIPHSVSLRVLNLCRYAAWCEKDEASTPSTALYRAIYKNALFLEHHIEYEVGGNHLIENAIALIVAGVVFRQERPEWKNIGLQILEQAGNSQFLEDGGHFERSPMYHVMVLQRYITASDILRDSGHELNRLHQVTQDALGFLYKLSCSLDDIPLLNDSVYGEQLPASTCLEYGHRCSFTPNSVDLDVPEGSGYRILENDIGTLIFDVGEIGPPHLPAHSHNDQLSIILWVDDQPILTDTGVYDYAPNARRQYSRSVKAHNTAQFDTVEPIQTGGRYLMGKRNAPIVVDQDTTSIAAEFTRDDLLKKRYTHRRRITTFNSGWEVSDIISGDLRQPVTVRFHFAPGCEIESHSQGFSIYPKTGSSISFQFSGTESATVSQSRIFEYFGQESQRPVIEAKGSIENEIVTEISIKSDETETFRKPEDIG